MLKCLKCFNFGTDIIRWIKCFYNDVKSLVTNSGCMTEFFHIKRGLRQGCPLSAYLFIICIELLAAAVRENKNIGGISLFEMTLKVQCLQMMQPLHWMGLSNHYESTLMFWKPSNQFLDKNQTIKKHCPTNTVFKKH